MRRTHSAQMEEVEEYYQRQDVRAEPPPTPEQVVYKRMQDAFETLRRMPATTGPKAFGSNWPNILNEFSDLVDEQSWWQYKRDTGAIKLRLEGWQISEMDEALRWPVLYLSDYPKGADALNTSSMAVAFDHNLDALMRGRAKNARQLADFVSAQLNDKRKRELGRLAFDSSQWAKMRYNLSPRTKEAIERIVENARIRLERDLKKHGVSTKMIIVTPASVSPDKCISGTSIERHRYIAAQRIARALEGK